MSAKKDIAQAAEAWAVHANMDHSIGYALRWTTYVWMHTLSRRDRLKLALVALGIRHRAR